MEELYKVIITDDFDRDTIADRLYQDNLIKEVAEQIAKTKNQEEDEKLVSVDYYMAVPTNYKLFNPYEYET
jgi:hypothetical protein